VPHRGAVVLVRGPVREHDAARAAHDRLFSELAPIAGGLGHVAHLPYLSTAPRTPRELLEGTTIAGTFRENARRIPNAAVLIASGPGAPRCAARPPVP
jgi:hypothetical protein